MQRLGRVVILDLHADDPAVDASVEEAILSAAEVFVYDCKTADEIVKAADGADVLLFKACLLNRSVLERLGPLKGIVRYGIGMDKIDLSAAKELGIPVCNVPDASTREVATHNLMLALACLRALPAMQTQSATGNWRIPPGTELRSPSELVFGTVGFGRIAKETLKRAMPFGFRLAAADPFVDAMTMAEEGVAHMEQEELLAAADVLVVQCPVTEKTRHFLNARTLRLMKPSAVLVNTARGELLDTDALVAVLEEGRFLGVGVDVAEPEPLPANHPLYAFKRVIVTPHAAWYSEEVRQRVRRSVAEEALRLLHGKPPLHRVA